MLEHLKLRGVGPAAEMEMEVAPRLNLITGDNGLGKTFLLDIAWWALTRTWVRLPAAPRDGFSGEPQIGFRLQPIGEQSYEFDFRSYSWQAREPEGSLSPVQLSLRALPTTSLVAYARVDGSFSAWDPFRNVQLRNGSLPPAFIFDPSEVWDGLPSAASKKMCNGLIQDWASWQREKGDAFEQLRRVLVKLSPSPEELLTPGELKRVSLDDVRDQPTLRMPYRQDVPLVHAAAGIRRIVALAYLLVWLWQEHLRAGSLLRQRPIKDVVLLVDEIEAHLHPSWQRRVVPALLEVMEELTGGHQMKVQLLAATHSPLVLASIEPFFDPSCDALWELDLVSEEVHLNRSHWRRHGDVNSWLSSSIFELAEPRSLEAEQAIGKALALLRRDLKPDIEEIEAVDRDLRRVLSDVEPFWSRWSYFVESARGEV